MGGFELDSRNEVEGGVLGGAVDVAGECGGVGVSLIRGGGEGGGGMFEWCANGGGGVIGNGGMENL